MPTKHRRTPEEKRILAAIAAMPYAKNVLFDGLKEAERTGRPITLHDLADFLEAYAPVVQQKQQDEEKTEAQLGAVMSDLMALGRLLQLAGIRC